MVVPQSLTLPGESKAGQELQLLRAAGEFRDGDVIYLEVFRHENGIYLNRRYWGVASLSPGTSAGFWLQETPRTVEEGQGDYDNLFVSFASIQHFALYDLRVCTTRNKEEML